MSTPTTRTLRFHSFGEPGDVLVLETAPAPEPAAGRIRVTVEACGIAPADWALCRGLFPGDLPRGVGCDVAGTVEAIGEGVTGTAIGDRVFGTSAWGSEPIGGAGDLAIMDHWFQVPAGLEMTAAAALPMALSTAHWHLDRLGVGEGQTVLINGAGTTIGYAAVQIALHRGAGVVAIAGETYAAALARLGATVVARGDGLVERVNNLGLGRIDAAFDTAPLSGAIPPLVELTGDPTRVLTCTDMEGAAEAGARGSFTEDPGTFTDEARYGFFDEYAAVAAEGRFEVPVAATYPLEEWRTALEVSLSGHARGKLLLVP